MKMTGYISTRLLLLRFFALLLLLTVITSLVIFLLADAKSYARQYVVTKASYILTDRNFGEEGKEFKEIIILYIIITAKQIGTWSRCT